MLCPYCQTENRDDEEKCYHCDRDLSMLRLIVNKAKHHYNQGLESAERGRVDEAITEMRNALDLDASLTNARVVLGTLYAKQEKFEEARREWEQALAFDHHYQKAHEYLAKAQTVERELPGIKRLRRLSQGLVVALGVVVLFAAIMLVFAVLNRPGRRGGPGGGRGGMVTTVVKGDGATTETLRGPFGGRGDLDARMEALLAEVQGLRGELSQAPRPAAGGNELEFASAALAAGSPQLALEFARKAEGERAREIQSQAEAAVLAALVADSEKYFAGKLDAETVLRNADKAAEALGASLWNYQVPQVAARVYEAEGNKLLQAANAAIAGSTLEDAIRTAAELKTRRPDLAEAVGLTLDLRLEVEGKKIAEEAENRASEGDFAGALARVDELAMAYRAAGRGDGMLGELRQSVLAKQNARNREDAQAAFTEKEWERFLELAAGIDTAALTAVQKEALETQQAQAKSRLAAANWAWFEKLDPKVSGGRLSEEEARRATAIYRQTLENLPGNLGWARAPILYYAAAAHLRLGENAGAAELIGEIETMEKVPDYIKGPLKQLKGRIEQPATDAAAAGQ